ncbi:MAG: 2-succinyl-6-hydroxy-2,4-cyclohexadiene-1-carboxylate synthase [Dehalococcoidia bacterium]|nr:2-succinyl-6-hydroxy-2,4-cyclohexadiene-1-carboxylate synthase [Dehalococcoidia bacterium]
MGVRVPVGDVALYVEERGEGPAVLLLHGFTGSVETWLPFLSRWQGFRTVAVDLLGHGRSDAPADPSRYAFPRCVSDLVALLDALGIGRVAVVGYSLGGRLALHLALALGERLWALVLESASPGIVDPRQRAARVRRDDSLAEQLLQEGLEAFVRLWEAQPLFASQSRLPATVRERLRRQRLSHSPVGLAAALRGMSVGRQEPLWRRLSEVRAPTLVIVGALDERYCDIGRRMAASLPRGELAVVPGAGHTVHLERPRRFASIVRDFLERNRPQ